MFKRVLFVIYLFGTACYNTFGQVIPADLYKAATIPDSLKENANSVVRFSENIMNVNGPGKMSITFHSIVTILNDKGDSEATIQLSYNNKYDNYTSIDIKVYNEKGESIKKYRKSDMYDGSETNGSNFVTDERFLALKHSIASYPVTIEVVYEEKLTSLITLGAWAIQAKEQSVQNSNFKILIDDKSGFRYLNKNTAIKPEKTTANGISTYLWKAANLKAIKLEEGALPWRVLPKVYFANNSFEFYGIPGDISSWENYGKWYLALNADVNSLSPAREEEIRKMTDTIKTDKEKARFLYSYMQKNMRYVSVQLGIGGLKPFPATFVDQKKYGDCKALVNYMYALLKAVNIPSYYALINAGANGEPADPAFPNDRFNHIVLCVPFKADTTWLECTSSTQPFGVLGAFTENRNALLITESGGKLVTTPPSTDQENQFNGEVHIALNANGGAKAQFKISSTGEYRSEYLQLASLKTDEQKEYLIRLLNIKQPSAFYFEPSSDNDGVKNINITLDYDKFSDLSVGAKQFYRPALFDLWGVTLPIEEKRKTDFYFEHPMLKNCVTTIDLPDGYEVETLPVNQKLSFSYGTYELTYAYDSAKNQVNSISKFNLKTQVIPAAKYNEMQEYMDAIAKAQNKKLVIRKKA
jgi:transglutaminase-like putative cysteine protease